MLCFTNFKSDEAKRQSFAFLLFRLKQRILHAGGIALRGFRFLTNKRLVFPGSSRKNRFHTKTKESKRLFFRAALSF